MFKLGAVNPIPYTEFTKAPSQSRPLIVAKNPEPNIFYTFLDNREEIMKEIKNDMNFQLQKPFDEYPRMK